MITVIKPILPLDKQQEEEIAKAETMKNKANVDYLSMMTGIDIPTEESEAQ